MPRPIIGLTPDQQRGRLVLSKAYVTAIEAAGGVPVTLSGSPEAVAQAVALCHGVVLSGGDDPIMTRWGRPTHPKATTIDPERQDRDLAVLHAAVEANLPLLGVCLGMQFMGLEAGGDLNQHLPDDHKRGELHADGAKHAVSGSLGDGTVHSRHHQAMRTSGTLDIVARAPDGVIEAVQDSQRDFYLGVQWHPERSGPGPLGLGVFRSLVAAAAGRMDFREHVSHAAS